MSFDQYDQYDATSTNREVVTPDDVFSTTSFATILRNLTTALVTTPYPVISSTMMTTTTLKPAEDCEQGELTWIKIALLGAILICLIILTCSLCITSFCYFSSLNSQNNLIDTSDPRAMTSSVLSQQQIYTPSRQSGPLVPAVINGNVPINHQVAPVAPNTLTTFKRLSVTQEKPRAPLSSSLQSPNTSSFSINMAPPSPSRSVSLGLGMDSPEETVVKKLALDRMEQEEAKRHMDLAMMAEKSTSMSPVKDQFNLETEHNQSPGLPLRKPERKQSDPGLKSNQKKKKKRGLAKGSKGKSKNSDPTFQNSVPSHKNPSFTLDNKTNKLLVSSSLKNNDSTSSPDKKLSV